MSPTPKILEATGKCPSPLALSAESHCAQHMEQRAPLQAILALKGLTGSGCTGDGQPSENQSAHGSEALHRAELLHGDSV